MFNIVSECTYPGYDSLWVRAEFGILPYSFLWSSGSTAQTTPRPIIAESLLWQTYSGSVTIVDANGCQSVSNYNTRIIPSPEIQLTSSSPSLNQCNGSIVTNVNQGFPPFTYLWSTGATTPNIDQLCAGVYELTITDSEGCPFYRTVDMTVLSTEEVDHDLDINIYPSPFVKNARLKFENNEEQKITASIIDIQGRVLITFINQETFPIGEIDFAIPTEEFGDGVYLLQLKTESGVYHAKFIKQ
jgi:Secretion system C-terminal sorting domain